MKKQLITVSIVFALIAGSVLQQIQAIPGLLGGGYDFHIYNTTDKPVNLYFDVKTKKYLKKEELPANTVLDLNARGWIVNKIFVEPELKMEKEGTLRIGGPLTTPQYLLPGQVIDPHYKIEKLDHANKYLVIVKDTGRSPRHVTEHPGTNISKQYARIYFVDKDTFARISNNKTKKNIKWDVVRLGTEEENKIAWDSSSYSLDIEDSSIAHATAEPLPQDIVNRLSE